MVLPSSLKNQHSTGVTHPSTDVTHPNAMNIDIPLFRFVILECVTFSLRFAFLDGGSTGEA